jgi:cholesterol oxidase
MYNVDNMNSRTMKALHELFGPVSVAGTKHLARIVLAGELVSADGKDIYMRNLKKLQPIRVMQVSGVEDGIWLDGSTRDSHEALQRVDVRSTLVEIKGYGHADVVIGKNAARDVWPQIAAFLLQDSPDKLSRPELGDDEALRGTAKTLLKCLRTSGKHPGQTFAHL